MHVITSYRKFYYSELISPVSSFLVLILGHKFLVEGSQAFKHWDELVFRRKNGYPVKEIYTFDVTSKRHRRSTGHKTLVLHDLSQRTT